MTDDTDDRDDVPGVEQEPYRVEFDAREEPVSTTLVTAVATLTDSEPTGMTPLGRLMDSDALDSLFRPPARGVSRGDIHLALEYHGHEVTIHSYGVIEIRPLPID